MMNKKIFQNPDLHIHSTFSDGTDTPSELLSKVKDIGIDVFSLTDHDAFIGCEQIIKSLKQDDPYFINGIELTCKNEKGKYHILGYGYDLDKRSIIEAAELTHNERHKKAQGRLIFLEKEMGMAFTDDEKVGILSQNNPGRPHLVALMLKKGYIKEPAEGFKLLNGYHGKEKILTPREAIDAILSANGIPVLAHGILADGTKKLTREEITNRVDDLKKEGLMGVECYYSEFTQEQKEVMLSLADKYNLMVTAGSDYHGLRKSVSLGETNNPDKERMKEFYYCINYFYG